MWFACIFNRSFAIPANCVEHITSLYDLNEVKGRRTARVRTVPLTSEGVLTLALNCRYSERALRDSQVRNKFLGDIGGY